MDKVGKNLESIHDLLWKTKELENKQKYFDLQIYDYKRKLRDLATENKDFLYQTYFSEIFRKLDDSIKDHISVMYDENTGIIKYVKIFPSLSLKEFNVEWNVRFDTDLFKYVVIYVNYCTKKSKTHHFRNIDELYVYFQKVFRSSKQILASIWLNIFKMKLNSENLEKVLYPTIVKNIIGNINKSTGE